jgi:glutamate N-acetyltransferase/amino-acid N-acetyltransferase
VDYIDIEGNVTAPKGFRAAGGHCGVKESGADLVLIHSDRPATAAATLTTNRFRAAPTYVTEQAVANGSARTIVANSGNANAATGEQGMMNALRMAKAAAQATGVAESDAIVCSTGIIGHQLPIEKIEAGIADLAGKLGTGDPETVARAIMTTDTQPKELAVEFDLDGIAVRIGGVCKGAGMICPSMATMLAFFTTDAAISAGLLQDALRKAVQLSFNCITVDGDMSTNDTVAILANGASGAPPIDDEDDPRFAAFCEALRHCATIQAKRIAADGEGSTKFVTVTVTGAPTWEAARQVARHLANYTLLKVAVFAAEFNWGRVAAATGAAGVDLDPTQTTLWLGDQKVFEAGEPLEADVVAGTEALKANDVRIQVDLGAGDQSATVWTCDLSPGYIEFNVDEPT